MVRSEAVIRGVIADETAGEAKILLSNGLTLYGPQDAIVEGLRELFPNGWLGQKIWYDPEKAVEGEMVFGPVH